MILIPQTTGPSFLLPEMARLIAERAKSLSVCPDFRFAFRRLADLHVIVVLDASSWPRCSSSG